MDAEIIKKVLKAATRNGGDFADLYIERTQPTYIHLEDDKIEKVVAGIDHGAGLRVISNGKSVYAYTNGLSEASLLELADTVSAAIKEKKAVSDIALINKNSKIDFKILLRPDKVDTDKKVQLVKKANDGARRVDNRIKQVMVIYRDTLQNVTIGNTEGYLAEDERIYTTAMIQVIAADGKIIQTGQEPIGGLIGFELFDKDAAITAAEWAAKRAVMMLKARPAPAGRMPVVLSSDAGGTMIHEAIGHGLEADLAMQGLSVYSKKIGERVASPIITVIDDATLPNKRGSFRFDDEGVDAQKTVLVEKGILKGYMYDRLWSMKEGAASTGNGRRESYKYRPIPRMTNTLIAPGSSNPEEIIRSTPSGLFVKKMGGGQVNTVNGDFVFEVSEGYLIKDGMVGEPVRGATLTGNGPEVLKNIDMVGNDLGFSIGTCGKDGQGVPVSDAQPTLRITSLTVGGLVEG
ncbi:MAG: TldD/PmbA family protein [Nitrospirae bacterium]|nr:TldD/PmbA family protein [Nitrospirota bacterium]